MNKVLEHNKVLLQREYGSNITKIAEYITTISDKTERTEYAKKLVKLIEKLNPSVRYAENTEDLLWQHVYILCEGNLDVNHEFPIPQFSEEFVKPKRISYSMNKPKASYYGKNVDLLMEKLAQITDTNDSENATLALGKLLKTFYRNWNNNSVKESVIKYDIERLSNGKLKLSMDLENSDELIFETRSNGSSKKRIPTRNGSSNRKPNRNMNNRNRNSK